VQRCHRSGLRRHPKHPSALASERPAQQPVRPVPSRRGRGCPPPTEPRLVAQHQELEVLTSRDRLDERSNAGYPPCQLRVRLVQPRHCTLIHGIRVSCSGRERLHRRCTTVPRLGRSGRAAGHASGARKASTWPSRLRTRISGSADGRVDSWLNITAPSSANAVRWQGQSRRPAARLSCRRHP
jgi:hypothetical protein